MFSQNFGECLKVFAGQHLITHLANNPLVNPHVSSHKGLEIYTAIKGHVFVPCVKITLFIYVFTHIFLSISNMAGKHIKVWVEIIYKPPLSIYSAF